MSLRPLSVGPPPAGLHPDAGLLILGDAETAPAGIPALALGLDGKAPSLLSLLESQEDVDAVLRPVDTGLVAFDTHAFDMQGGRACCRLSELVDGCESLSTQIEDQLWLLEGRSQFGDLIACLAGWRGLETVRILAAGHPA